MEEIYWCKQATQARYPYWPPKNGEIQWSHVPTSTGFNLVAPVVNPAETYAAFSIDNTISMLNMKDGHIVWSNEQEDSLLGMQWNGNGSRLLTWTPEGKVRLWYWNESSHALTKILELVTQEPIYRASLNPSETKLLTLSAQGKLRIWQVWPDLEALLSDTQLLAN